MQEFMRLVESNNSHFSWFRESSLASLIQTLGGPYNESRGQDWRDIPPSQTDRICVAAAAIPDVKAIKYQAALAFLSEQLEVRDIRHARAGSAKAHRYSYIPINDLQLNGWRAQLSRPRKPVIYVSGGNCLAVIGDNSTLYVLTHGRTRSPDEIGAQVRAGEYEYMTAEQLADDLYRKGLNPARKVKMKLFACWGGKHRSGRGVGETLFGRNRSFAQQLYQLLLYRYGYRFLVLDAYLGAVEMVMYDSPHKLVSMNSGAAPLPNNQTNKNSGNWDEDGNFGLDGYGRMSQHRVRYGPVIAW